MHPIAKTFQYCTLPAEIQTCVAHLLSQSGRKILGIAGPPGSGKSTLAAQIAEYLGVRCQVVPMDGFHLAQSEIDRMGLTSRKGSPPTFDSAGFAALMQRIRHQQPDEVIYAPIFKREIEEPLAGAIAVLPETELIVTEGNYLLLQEGHWGRIKPLLDAVWYVDIDPALGHSRLLARHQQFGRSAQEASAWIAQNDALNADLIEASRGRADLFIQL